MIEKIKNAHGERLDYTFHPGASDAHIVVLGHGVTGNKDRPFLVALAKGIAAAGVPVLRFSFAGNGDSEGRFEDATISKEVEDLGAVLSALEDRTVCFVGHSMGGAVGVLRASQDPRIRCLISLAGMVDTRGFAHREFADVTPDQGCMWDEPTCPLSQAYIDDMNQIDTVVDKASQIAVPWLLVHGTEDDVVPIQDSRDIFAGANDPKQLIEIPGADHVFNGDATPAMVEAVVAWVKTPIAAFRTQRA
ncbi:MAG: alpha/beta fold hydrolase [Gemmatimonadetes bacterium]|nr:alpha/beta fold hydrolase [Gemmatimonadota bacterium]